MNVTLNMDNGLLEADGKILTASEITRYSEQYGMRAQFLQSPCFVKCVYDDNVKQGNDVGHAVKEIYFLFEEPEFPDQLIHSKYVKAFMKKYQVEMQARSWSVVDLKTSWGKITFQINCKVGDIDMRIAYTKPKLSIT